MFWVILDQVTNPVLNTQRFFQNTVIYYIIQICSNIPGHFLCRIFLKWDRNTCWFWNDNQSRSYLIWFRYVLFVHTVFVDIMFFELVNEMCNVSLIVSFHLCLITTEISSHILSTAVHRNNRSYNLWSWYLCIFIFSLKLILFPYDLTFHRKTSAVFVTQFLVVFKHVETGLIHTTHRLFMVLF